MAVDIHSRELRIVGHDNDTVLDLRPIQGLWTEEQYLAMSDHSRRLLEFDDGYIEVLPMLTDKHQAVSQFVFLALLAFIQRIGEGPVCAATPPDPAGQASRARHPARARRG